MKYRNKLLTIEAIQWTGNNEKEVKAFVGVDNVRFAYKILDGYNVREVDERPKYEEDLCCAYANIKTTFDGYKTARQGDFIIRSVSGEIYMYKQIVFESHFERME